MYDNLFILGAGASKEDGAPLMNEFIDKAEDFIYQNKYRKEDDAKYIYDKIKRMNTVHAKSNIDADNIETILGIFEMEDLANENQSTNIKSKYINFIAETIDLSISEVKLFDSINYRNSVYNTFIGKINKLGGKNAIISFNYDLCLDAILYHEDININYCLNGTENIKNHEMPYLKLHGSLNWYLGNNKEVKPYHMKDILLEYYNRKNNRFKEKYSINEHIELKFKNEIIGESPFIIPPSWNKSAYNAEVRNVWTKAYQVIGKSQNIYIIGYSLPESDSFFKFLYYAGTNNDNRIRSINIINPAIKEIEIRFRELFGNGLKSRLNFIDSKFSQWCER